MTPTGPGEPADPQDAGALDGHGESASPAPQAAAPPRPRLPAGWPRWEPPILGRRPADLPDRGSSLRYAAGRHEPMDLQVLLTAAGEAVREIDIRRLAHLAPERVSAQGAARWELYGYLDQIWSELKAAGLEDLDPLTRQSLAGLRDIAGALCSDTDHFKFRR